MFYTLVEIITNTKQPITNLDYKLVTQLTTTLLYQVFKKISFSFFTVYLFFFILQD